MKQKPSSEQYEINLQINISKVEKPEKCKLFYNVCVCVCVCHPLFVLCTVSLQFVPLILTFLALCLLSQEHDALALRREGTGVVLDSDLPYLLAIDDNILSTGMRLYHLKVTVISPLSVNEVPNILV